MFSVSESGERAEAGGQGEGTVSFSGSLAHPGEAHTDVLGLGVDLFGAVPKGEINQAGAGPTGHSPPCCVASVPMNTFLLV